MLEIGSTAKGLKEPCHGKGFILYLDYIGAYKIIINTKMLHVLMPELKQYKTKNKSENDKVKFLNS